MYPLVLDIRGRLCVVIGGGRVARRKVVALLEADGRVRVISPVVSDELQQLADSGTIELLHRKYADGDLEEAFLIFAATDDAATQELVCRHAAEGGQLINVVDAPERCTFHVPATCHRGELAIAVSTNGRSPALAAMIREELEIRYGPEYEVLLAIMARVRQHLGAGSDTQAERKKIYKKILHADIVEWIRSGQRDRLRQHLEDVLGQDIELDIPNLEPGVS